MTYAFCPNCGISLDPSTDTLHHQSCASCGHITYHNPRPVAINMIPCLDEHLGDPVRTRWLVGQRNIHPKIGEFAMTSGFMELGETVEESGAREFGEETGIWLPEGTPSQIMGSLHVPKGQQLLIFVAWPAMKENVIDGFVPNTETQALAWHTVNDPIAFDLHAQALRNWGARAIAAFHR